MLLFVAGYWTVRTTSFVPEPPTVGVRMTAPAQRTDELSLLDYLAVLRRRWPWVVLCLALTVGAAAAYTLTQTATYQATARVLLADSAAQRALDPSSQNTGFLTREMSNEISLALSDTVESRVIDALDGTKPDISITADANADVLVFRATAGDADEAALHANTWAEQYIGAKQDEAVAAIDSATVNLQDRLAQLREDRQELRQPLDALQTRINATDETEVQVELQREYDLLADDLSYELGLLDNQAAAAVASISELELQTELASVGEARIVQVAAPPVSPSNAPLSRNLALAVTLGLLAGAGLALLLDARDTSIKTFDDIVAVTSIPILAGIPEVKPGRKSHGPELAGLVDPQGVVADGYQKVRSAIEFLELSDVVRSILITSAGPSEGKSTSSANLAAAMAAVGKRTLLLDVDFRRPRVHKIFDLPQQPGLGDHVIEKVEPEKIAHHVGGKGVPLYVITCGTVPPTPASFVATDRFLRATNWLTNQADVTVFDAPPLLTVSEAHSLAKHVDIVVLTVMANKTTQGELLAAIDQLDQVGANVAGIVVVGMQQSATYGKYYYYSSDAESYTASVTHPPTGQVPVIDLSVGGGRGAAQVVGDPRTGGQAMPVPGAAAATPHTAGVAPAADWPAPDHGGPGGVGGPAGGPTPQTAANVPAQAAPQPNGNGNGGPAVPVQVPIVDPRSQPMVDPRLQAPPSPGPVTSSTQPSNGNGVPIPGGGSGVTPGLPPSQFDQPPTPVQPTRRPAEGAHRRTQSAAPSGNGSNDDDSRDLGPLIWAEDDGRRHPDNGS